MVPLAPRYPPRLVAALWMIEDDRVPMAEICRRLGEVAAQLGVPRPSYSHVRRLLVVERARREEVREVVEDATRRYLGGRVVDPGHVLERLGEIGPRRR